MRRMLMFALLAGALLVACGGAAPSQAGGPTIVVTTDVLGDAVRNLVGGRATVHVLIPRGVGPHDFQPSARQLAQIRAADAVVVVGAGFEGGLLDTIASAEADGVVTIAAIDAVRTLPAGDGHDEAHGDDAHAHDGVDPHFFTDPARMAEAVAVIADELAARVPDLDAEALDRRASAYLEQLRDLDAEVERMLADVPPERRRLVTSHDMLRYFADRYDFELLGAVVPSSSTEAEPSAGQLDALARLLQDENVPAIFVEASSPTRLSETLAAEAGHTVEIVPVYGESLGPEESGAATYAEAVRTNAERIATALGREPAAAAAVPVIGWFTETFELAFMQRALVAGLLAAATTAVIGTWVVLRGLTFLGDAIAHGVVPGLALAVLWGFSPIAGALVAALVMSGAITLVTRRTNVRDDTGIGLLFVGMLALGVVIISRSATFTTDVTSLLFGDVLGVTVADLRGQGIGAALVIVVSTLLYRPFITLAFNRDKAATLGMHPSAAHAVMLALIATSIVASFQAIGTLLVFGLLIGPPATAGLLVRRVPLVMGTAVLIGAATVVAGLVVSYHHDTAGGATIAGLAVAVFFVVLTVQQAGRAIRTARRRIAA